MLITFDFWSRSVRKTISLGQTYQTEHSHISVHFRVIVFVRHQCEFSCISHHMTFLSVTMQKTSNNNAEHQKPHSAAQMI